ncbi:MAG: outer membrane lipoprotein LolB [Algicola sp.]|nr:outer membrane lipoprotein LolB [Algicola sp.]
MKNCINTSKKARWLLILLTINLLGGCQVFKREQPQTIINKSEQQRQLALTQLQHWQVKGKLIFKSPQEKFSASLNWTQQSTHSDIRLTSFLGMSILKMLNDGNIATLISDGKTLTSDDPESLLYETKGITLPINDMPHWMKGLTSKDFDRTTVFDEHNRVKQIKLLDATGRPWQIDYQSYLQATLKRQNYQLPKKIRLTGNNITIIIKISDWELY